MDLRLSAQLTAGYHSKSQQARVVSESWGENELFCAACMSDRLDSFKNNNAASDFQCPTCRERYQLKSQSRPFARRVLGANYQKMCDAIAAETAPSYYLLHYARASWMVRDLMLVPHLSVTLSALVKRPPLRATARRANWEGYFLDLDRVPDAAKIAVVRDGTERPKADVRADYARIAPVLELKTESRGWTLDVLRCVERVKHSIFRNEDVYSFEGELAKLHPENRHVVPKIRQQLQNCLTVVTYPRIP
jgi:type II restriction enzyme